MEKTMLFTSESVTEGHPDKMCDKISDAILDAFLEKDPNSRVACEVSATTGIITVLGEVTSEADIDVPLVVRKTVREIGYCSDAFGFNSETCGVILAMDRQSEDIDIGVRSSLENKKQENRTKASLMEAELGITGAGDQGMMFGYACCDTDTLMPAPIYYAHKLCQRLSEVRKDFTSLGPDGKSMVTFRYKDGVPEKIDTIVISIQHLADMEMEELYRIIRENVILPVIPAVLLDEVTRILVNPTGRFVKGGPCADTGLTGRKIIVDTYGGMGKHGGGAFSGKDPTKVDRTGAYAARYVAKNIVAAKLAQRCEVQIAYAIGVAHPVSVSVDTFGTSSVSDSDLSEMVTHLFDLRPGALILQFKMNRPVYKDLAAYGHLGREDLDSPWEKTDKTKCIMDYLGARGLIEKK